MNSYPNPFENNTTITFELPEEGQVTVKILDYSGKVVEELYEGFAEGRKRYLFSIDSRKYTAGMYVCMVQQANGKVSYHKMIHIK